MQGTGILILIIVVAVIFLPLIIAVSRRASHASCFGVMLLNTIAAGLTLWVIFDTASMPPIAVLIVGLPKLGFAMVAWFTSLIWACVVKSGEQADREERAAAALIEMARDKRSDGSNRSDPLAGMTKVKKIEPYVGY
jgi:hypothetical protein